MSEVDSATLSGVPATLLIKLYIRAIESARPDALVKDERAEALVRSLPDVAACRIETDAAGRVVAVHVVSRTTPAPATLAQDVALFLSTETDLDQGGEGASTNRR